MGGFFSQTSREQVNVRPQGQAERSFEDLALSAGRGSLSLADTLGQFAGRLEPTLQALLAETRAGAGQEDILSLVSGAGRGISRDIRRVLSEDFRRIAGRTLETGRSEGRALTGALGLGGSPGSAPVRDTENAVVQMLGNILLQSPTALDSALAVHQARLGRRAQNTAALGPLAGLLTGTRGLQLQGLGQGADVGLGGRGQDLAFRANTAERTTTTNPSLFDVGLTGVLAGGALGVPNPIPGVKNLFGGLFGGGGSPVSSGYTPGYSPYFGGFTGLGVGRR